MGYGVKIVLPSPPNYVTRSSGGYVLSFSDAERDKDKRGGGGGGGGGRKEGKSYKLGLFQSAMAGVLTALSDIVRSRNV